MPRTMTWLPPRRAASADASLHPHAPAKLPLVVHRPASRPIRSSGKARQFAAQTADRASAGRFLAWAWQVELPLEGLLAVGVSSAITILCHCGLWCNGGAGAGEKAKASAD